MEIYIILLKTRGPPCDGDESDGWNVIQTAKKKGSQRVFTACSILRRWRSMGVDVG